MTQPTGKVTRYTDVPAQAFGDEAPGVTIRWIIDEEHDGATNYALRVIEVAPGGHTPDHSHPYEHENFVLEGRGRVRMGDEDFAAEPGFLFTVPARVEHRFHSVGEDLLLLVFYAPALGTGAPQE